MARAVSTANFTRQDMSSSVRGGNMSEPCSARLIGAHAVESKSLRGSWNFVVRLSNVERQRERLQDTTIPVPMVIFAALARTTTYHQPLAASSADTRGGMGISGRIASRYSQRSVGALADSERDGCR